MTDTAKPSEEALKTIYEIERHNISRSIRVLSQVNNPNSGALTVVSRCVSKYVFKDRPKGQSIGSYKQQGVACTQEFMLRDLNTKLEATLEFYKLRFLCKFIYTYTRNRYQYGFEFIDVTLIDKNEELVQVLLI